MARKRWTPNDNVDDDLLTFREKRKWQIALRRYIFEGKGSSEYAPFFGLDAKNFRIWVELQFDDESDWANFGKIWQFDHIIPVAYFNFKYELDLRLCWNFINIRVEKFALNKNRGNRIDVLGAKAYFERLYEKTGYPLCLKMVDKIERIEVSEIKSTEKLEGFIRENDKYLQQLADFSAYEFSRLNAGVRIEEIIEERRFFNSIKGEK